jgi:hypothetical protein
MLALICKEYVRSQGFKLILSTILFKMSMMNLA